jgi:tetratricopeptide (TPR) repeat protein
LTLPSTSGRPPVERTDGTRRRLLSSPVRSIGPPVSSEREKILQAAQKYVEKKRYDRAILEYQKIVQQDPNDARTLLKIGDLQVRMQTYPEAIATYERVGQYYAAQGFALKAIAVYKQIREIIKKHAPQLADRYGHIVPKLAEIYTQLGLTSDALSAYDEVATRFQRGGRDRDAIDIFRKMVELDATNPLPHLRLAEACCRVQSLDEAIDSFWTAAELLLKLGRPDDALKVVERILHFRQDPKYAKVAAELYLKRGRRDDCMQALARLQIAFQADPRDLDTLHLLAQAFTGIEQESKSIEVYKEMARIARDAGKAELLDQLMAHLLDVAPDDEQVRALAALPKVEPEEPSEPSELQVADSDVELIEDEITGSEQPFELARSSRPPVEQERPAAAVPMSAREVSAQRWEPRAPMASAPDVVVIEDQVQVVEEQPAGDDAFDALAHARKAIIDAESFRRLRLYSKAIEALQIALEIDPRSVDIRDKLKELLRDSGDYDAAIGESVTLAGIYLENGDGQRAEVLLYEVLEQVPDHALALEMLTQLAGRTDEVRYPGYAPAESFGEAYAEQYGPRPEGTEQAYDDLVDYSGIDQAPAGPTYSADDSYDPHAPLPSYDLEEVGASSALASVEPHAAVARTRQSRSYEQLDDPFGQSAEQPLPSEPLPSFPLGGEEDDLMAGLPPAGVERPALPSFSEVEEPTDWEAEAEPIASQRPPAIDHSEVVEEALEEADFFASRGLYEDARAILLDQLTRLPTHPILRERIREVENAIAAAGESGTIEKSRLGPAAQQAEPEPISIDDDAVFDIAASLEALDQLEIEAPVQEAAGLMGAGNEVDVDQVFAKFKEGVRSQVAESDSQTHYDLGVAYKEMGLLPDAIQEFEVAARDPSRECPCYAMIGMIRLERGELDLAAEAYKRALEAPEKIVEQEMALYYDLGNVYEMKAANDEALYYFQKIARRDPGFRDVKDRIEALQPPPPPAKAAQQARAVNDDDEFDRVFDDLFDTK